MEVIIENPQEANNKERKRGRTFLIIALVCFIFMIVPEPTKFIPGLDIVEEVAAGGIGLSSLLIYVLRYWLFNKVKKAVIGSTNR
jgi:hypothetical protein